MRNILFISHPVIDPNKGGVQRVTSTLADEFVKIGRQVFFLCLQPNAKQKIREDRQLFFSLNADFESRQREIKEIIEKHKIGYVINQAGIQPDAMAFHNAVQSTGAKFITVHHNCVKCLNLRYREIFLNNRSDFPWKLMDLPVVWKVLKELNRKKYGSFFRNAQEKSDCLLLLSDIFIPELSHYGVEIDSEKVKAIPNPASFKVPTIDFEEKENRILFVGRLEKVQKRVDRLLAIYEVLHQVLPDWHFDVVGDGSAREWMEEYCRKNNLERINFHGYQDPKKYLRRAKLFTLTSDFEGFGMVLVEAQAYGTVPIAFDSFSSIHEIISQGTTGILIPSFNESKYIEEITHLTRNSDRLLEYGKNAQNNVSKFEASFIAGQWEKVIFNGSI